MFYSAEVLEHFFDPHNVGRIEDPDGVGLLGDPSCGDFLRLYIKVADGRLADVKFEVYGCPAAIATTSILTDLVMGKPLNEALTVTDEDIVRALGGLPDPKIHCSDLGAQALHRAIEDYRRREIDNGGTSEDRGKGYGRGGSARQD